MFSRRHKALMLLVAILTLDGAPNLVWSFTLEGIGIFILRIVVLGIAFAFAYGAVTTDAKENDENDK